MAALGWLLNLDFAGGTAPATPLSPMIRRGASAADASPLRRSPSSDGSALRRSQETDDSLRRAVESK